MAKQEDMAKAFEAKTGIAVEVIPIDEKELGKNPIIISVSLGETRRFDFKHKAIKTDKTSINLNSGSLLIMREGVQENWKHQIPQQLKVNQGRINLTFRMVD